MDADLNPNAGAPVIPSSRLSAGEGSVRSLLPPTADAIRDPEWVATTAESNPLVLLEALRASGSPLHEILLPPGIEALAAMISYDEETHGIEPGTLELLLRTSIYLDRLFEARSR